MKSTIDRLEGLSRKVTVEIPAEKVQQAFEEVYKAIQKKANIKGFRPGKAPLPTIKTIYGDQVKTDVVNDLVNEAYQTALEEHRLEPIGYPKVTFDMIEEGKSFTFSAEFEIRPEVELNKYEGLQVVKEKLSIEEERIATILENLRKEQAEFTTVFDDRALGESDVAVIDFSGFVNDQPLPNGSAEGHQLEIGTNQFIEGFEQGLIGMKIGDQRTLNLRFPDAYHEKSLSGAPVRFDVKLKGIKQKVLPELTDEFAQKLGGGGSGGEADNAEFKTLDDLKKRIRKDVEESENKRIQEDLRNRIVKALVEANPVAAPQTLVAQQKETLVEDFKGRMQQQGLTDLDFEEYKKKWDSEFEQSAKFMVKSTFLLDAIAEKLKLRATPSEVDAKIQEYGTQTGLELERLREYYSKPERRSRLMFQVTEEKVVNHLMANAQITEVSKEQLPTEERV